MRTLRSGFLIACAVFGLPGDAQTIDLKAAAAAGGFDVYGRTLSTIDEPGHAGIRLNAASGEGVAWLKGVDLKDGTIEFDVRGADIVQHSFVGIAFHGANDTTFEALYLRPFRFKEPSDSLRNRSIQYISLPAYTWRVLRSRWPGTYEHAIDPPPDPNGWVHVRVVVQGGTITTYINGAREPSLVVRQVTPLGKGRVGFYVADTSGGDFANITITPAK